MRYIITYEDAKVLNYILSVNENNQINEGLIDRIKEVAEKGLLKANTIKFLEIRFLKNLIPLRSFSKTRVQYSIYCVLEIINGTELLTMMF